MNNIKVRTKLVIVMVIALIALALCAVISNTSLSGLGDNALDIIENDMRSSYDEQIKAQVDNVISLCQSIYNRYEKGEYTLDEAKKLAADQIRDLRYGNNGYFWVDTYDGTNVVLLGNDTEGTNFKFYLYFSTLCLFYHSIFDIFRDFIETQKSFVTPAFLSQMRNGFLISNSIFLCVFGCLNPIL
mgnify:CR=1 FL=1